MKTCLVQLKVGDPIMGFANAAGVRQEGFIKSIKLVPNGMNDPKLVAVVSVKFPNGNWQSATSDKFEIVDDYEYTSVYED